MGSAASCAATPAAIARSERTLGESVDMIVWLSVTPPWVFFFGSVAATGAEGQTGERAGGSRAGERATFYPRSRAAR
eukprot:5705125-Prymnesium_polylepis.1